MSPAKVNVLGLTQKPLLETIWRMAESALTIFAGDRAWIIGCLYHRCSNRYRRDYRRVGHTIANEVIQTPRK
jgi:hypothetical protein